jgi:hypothetical protein
MSDPKVCPFPWSAPQQGELNLDEINSKSIWLAMAYMFTSNSRLILKGPQDDFTIQ